MRKPIQPCLTPGCKTLTTNVHCGSCQKIIQECQEFPTYRQYDENGKHQAYTFMRITHADTISPLGSLL